MGTNKRSATPTDSSQQGSGDPLDVRQVLETTRLLESISENRALLADLDPETRTSLLKAAGLVARPGPWAKRELARAVRRKRQEQVRRADEAVLARAGIRVKRAAPVFETPKLGRAPINAVELRDAKPTHDVAAIGATPATEETAAGKTATLGTDGSKRQLKRSLGARSVTEPRTCYVCKTDFHELHFFYDQMCGPCAEFNWRKRQQSADLRGRVALVTGGRVKIGYQAAIFLLRAGAQVVVSTRFPKDAAERFGSEEDFSDWGKRLHIYGLDLRHTPSVEAFARHLLNSLTHLDFIINNACQTVRRPAGFYGHLLEAEYAATPAIHRSLLTGYEALRGREEENKQHGLLASAAAAGVRDPVQLSQLALLEEDLSRSGHIFPEGQLDADLQQVDLRSRNSWRLPLAEVPTVELLEVHLVNAVAPFVLNSRLKPLMLRRTLNDKHIVNVSAMEGQFYRSYKTDKHPHTNMAKAALNMLTRTSAADYVRDGIHMNSVDTGWITDEDPADIAARKTAEHGFHPPLDIVDGAARIVDPIFDGFNSGKHVWGLFLKDYKPTDW